MEKTCHVVCVCCGYGFPNGMAQVSRIRMVGKALVAEGCRFTVFNIGAGPCPNSASCGTVDGIDFEYLPGARSRPENFWKRQWLYGRGLLKIYFKLYKLRKMEKDLCVYLWAIGDGHPFLYRFMRAIHLPIIKEVNEWWPGAERRLVRDRAIKVAQGTLAISRPIIDRLKSLPSYTNKHKLLHLPILIDPNEWVPCVSDSVLSDPLDDAVPYVLWCGDMDASDEDINFLLRVMKVVNDSETCRIVLVGKYKDSTRARIQVFAETLGLDESLITLSGFVPDDEFNNLMHRASALLLPIWETERSICRFPTKLGHYLASSTPVVSTALGDLTYYLRDGESAFLVPPGEVHTFAEKVVFLIRNGEQAEAVGREGRLVAIQHFSIEAHKSQIARFFTEMAK